MQAGLRTRNIAHGPEITTVCYEIEKPSRRADIFERRILMEPNVLCGCVRDKGTGMHTVSLSEPCLLRHPTCLIFINLAKNDAREGQSTDALACGPNLCMKRVV